MVFPGAADYAVQKALERVLEEVELVPDNPELVAEMKVEAERMEDAPKLER